MHIQKYYCIYKSIKAGGWQGGDIGRPGAVRARAEVWGLRGMWGAGVSSARSGAACVEPEKESHSCGVAERPACVANARRGHSRRATKQ